MSRKVADAKIRGEEARAIANIRAEDEIPAQAFWLSFAGDEGFRGALIIHANDFIEAIVRANLAQLNPHGEVKGMPIPAETAAKIPASWKNRLLNRSECGRFDAEMKAALPQ